MRLWTLDEIRNVIPAKHEVRVPGSVAMPEPQTPAHRFVQDQLSGNAEGRGDSAIVTGISIDTRTIKPGDLFVALPGEKIDGAQFVDDALAKGAVAAICSKNYSGEAQNVFVVDDPLAALWDLARVARQRTHAKIIAVTGSVGKTSTKEMLAHVFAAVGKTHATIGNLNNHIGLPLTLARMPADTEFAVLEMGMNHANEIAPLSKLARPDIAIITTVDAVHLENFENVEGIADAKAEIFSGLTDKTGIAILNRDNPYYLRLLQHAQKKQLKLLTFGTAPDCDAQLLGTELFPTHAAVHAAIHGEELHYAIGTPGAHWVPNSLAVLLAVSAVGENVSAAAAQLKTISPPKGRGVIRAINLSHGGVITVMDESYNASPVSVAASLATLGQMPKEQGGRRIAALGDMLELGPHGPEFHRDLAGAVVGSGVDLLFCAGPLMQGLYEEVPPSLRGAWAADSALLAAAIKENLKNGDVLLVKGSRGTKMEVILSVLENA